jgi:hypothetical protein
MNKSKHWAMIMLVLFGVSAPRIPIAAAETVVVSDDPAGPTTASIIPLIL